MMTIASAATREKPSGPASIMALPFRAGSDVDVGGEGGAFLDELEPQLRLAAHQPFDQIVGFAHLVDRNLHAQQRAVLRAHGGFFQLGRRSEEHTSELQSLMRISYAVFCLKKKKRKNIQKQIQTVDK